MNAQEKAKVLKQAGYDHNIYYDDTAHCNLNVWWLKASAKGQGHSFAQATHEAYQHYLDNQAPATEAPKQNTWYTVQEHIETTYKTDDYSGKRYPSDYSVYEVINGDTGLAVDSFSAKEHGLEDAEYMANELRDKLNKALPRPATVTEDMSHIQEVPQPLTQLHDEIAALQAKNAELAMELLSANTVIAASKVLVETITAQVEKLQASDAKHAKMALDAQETIVQLKRRIKTVRDDMGALLAFNQSSDSADLSEWVTKLTNALLASEALQAESEAVTLNEDALTWAARVWDGHKLFEPAELKLDTDNPFFEANLASRQDNRVYQLRPEFDTKANWSAITARRKELS